MYIKYTKELLEEVVPGCTSYSQVARALGVKPIGSTITHLHRRCDSWNVDTSHFVGQASALGRPAYNRLTADDIFVWRLPEQGRAEASKLRRALIEVDTPEVCCECGISTWNGKPLRLQVDHIDGQYWNNTRENLRFICPNCHTQTDTWGRTKNG
jgi:hypothetical protein